MASTSWGFGHVNDSLTTTMSLLWRYFNMVRSSRVGFSSRFDLSWSQVVLGTQVTVAAFDRPPATISDYFTFFLRYGPRFMLPDSMA